MNTGVTYINWGESTCPTSNILLYEGTIVQTTNPAGTLQCLQQQLDFRTFDIPSPHLSPLRTLSYSDSLNKVRPIKCAVCYVPNHTSKFVNLGSKFCPINWTKEFDGALTALRYEFFSDSVCVNESLLSLINWKASGYNVNDLNLVESQCAKKPCVNGQVSCALCTR